MSSRLSPFQVYGIAIWLMIVNLAVTFATLPIDFIPAQAALWRGVVYGGLKFNSIAPESDPDTNLL